MLNHIIRLHVVAVLAVTSCISFQTKHMIHGKTRFGKRTGAHVELPTLQCKYKTEQAVALLTDLWTAVSRIATQSVSNFVLQDYNLNRFDIEGIIEHFQVCRDCAADEAFLMAARNDKGEDILQLVRTQFTVLTEESDDDDWGMWAEIFSDASNIGMRDDEVFPVESNDAVVVRDTMKWVDGGIQYK